MNKISERELLVARYYMKRDAFVAALNRSKYVLENYPQSVHQEEALVISVSAYNKLGIYDLEKDVKRVLELNFPDSDFGKQKKEVDVDKWWKFWDIID
jgi:outer membrane protein assembly factor BamD